MFTHALVKHPLRWVLFVSPFVDENWDVKYLTHAHIVRNGGASIWIQANWLWSANFLAQPPN